MATTATVTVDERVRALCRVEGFEIVRFAPATLTQAARDAAQAALDEGRLADMAWMTGEWLDRATDPQRFLADARTAILVALPYHGDEAQTGPGVSRGRIARYARGRDYHRVFETKLRRIARTLREEFGAGARATVDYGPLLERPLAAAAGMGWLGKSTMLLVPGFGPWVLLGAIATTLELAPDRPLAKSCGSCTRCVVACPTGALGADGSVLDARLCISYHTIENRGPIPRELRAKFGDWVFGCDECLDSCPVGAANHDAYADFVPPDLEHARPALAGLLTLDEAAFRARFKGRAIMRARRDGLVRNACIALGNVGGPDDLAALISALNDASPLVRGHAAWAVSALANRHGLQPAARAALERCLEREQDSAVREELTLAITELGTRDSGLGSGAPHGNSG
ncbi:MAG: tRNA epoxyqueuosine(34) reductase QueG [Anaerolinea sp.]|nr:tRNA epoxyqueuosine(34) reductase QueG [Anaerolinea sp.]